MAGLVGGRSENQECALGDREELTGRKALVPQALKVLNQREYHILFERRLKDTPVTLEGLSRQYGISRERIRQIEERAFQKLQKAMKTLMSEVSRRHNDPELAKTGLRVMASRPALDNGPRRRLTSQGRPLAA